MTTVRDYPLGMSDVIAQRVELILEADIRRRREDLADTIDLYRRRAEHGHPWEGGPKTMASQALHLRQAELGYEALVRNSPTRYEEFRPALYRGDR